MADEVLREWAKPTTFCDAVDQARLRVRALATATSHQARASAADALFAIADVMLLDPKTAARTDELAKIRLHAYTLRHRRSFKGADSIKTALSRTIEVMASSWTEADVEPWVSTAKRSVAAIEGASSFSNAARFRMPSARFWMSLSCMLAQRARAQLPPMTCRVMPANSRVSSRIGTPDARQRLGRRKAWP